MRKVIFIPKGGKEIYKISKKELEILYWKENLTIDKIANKYGCSKNTISLRLRKYKIKIKQIKTKIKKSESKYKKINIPKDKLKELYLDKNLSAKAIAGIYGCHNRTILIKLYNSGIEVRGQKKIKIISKNQLEDLYIKKEYPARKIAEIIGCSKGAVLNYLHKLNIPVRTKWNKKEISKEKIKELYLDKRLSSRKIAKLCGCAYTTIDRKIKEYGFKTRSRAESHRIYPRKNFNGNIIEKAYLIGFSIGDLRVRKNWENSETLQVDSGSTKLSQIRLIKKLFSPYAHVWISKPNKKGKIQVQAHVNLSFSFLLTKKVPKWIFKNKETFFSFFSGFTDAEGCISVNGRNQAYYSLGNYDKELLSQIRYNLIKYRIPCRNLSIAYKKGKKTFEKYYCNNDYFGLSINKKDTLLKLINFIKPYIKHEDKINSLKLVENNITERNKK